MKRYAKTTAATLVAILLLAPGLVWAAGGGGGQDLVVVADTRVIGLGFLKYLANLYNTNVTLFAIWAVVLTLVYGSALAFLMDFIMKRTGIDLTSRKIVEH